MEEDTLYYKAKLPYTDKAPKGGETPFFLVILLLVFFPPAAWYVMWKEKHYHRWFAWLIGFYGLLTIIGSLVMRVILIPFSDSLYASLGLEQPTVSPFSYVDYYVYLGIAEIILAAVLYVISRKYTIFPRTWLIVGLLGLAFNSLIQPITQVYLTYSAYNNLVEQTRIYQPTSNTPSPTQPPLDISSTPSTDLNSTASPGSQLNN